MNEQASAPIEVPAQPWHSRTVDAVVDMLRADPGHGLTSIDAVERLTQNGPNTLHAEKEEPWWQEALEALTEPLQLLLVAVAGLYFWLGEIGDALTIAAVILTVAGIEVFTELRAKRAVAALSSMAAPIASVLRDGRHIEVATRDLVPGDVVLLAAGHRVPADLRLVEAIALRIDESSLTGESVSANKTADALLEVDTELGDRSTVAHAGSLVVAGKGRGVVVATGAATQLGRVAGLMREAREPRTPLQEALRQLSRWLVWVAIGFSVLVPVLGVLVAGRPIKEMLLVGLTLAFATIPEELPILISIVLGLGAYRMAQRNAIVKRLRAAETLGSVSVVATDKTGTLTENRMRVVSVVADAREQSLRGASSRLTAHRILLMGVLANDAQSNAGEQGPEFIGDPTETALLAAAQEAGIDVAAARSGAKVIEEFPFGDERKRMSVVVGDQGRRFIALKGSPESTLAVCTAIHHEGRNAPLDDTAKATLQRIAAAMASRGLRVLALAERGLATGEPTPGDAFMAERDLVFLGLVGLEDPPRAEVPAAVRALQDAGVRVLMVTGDHPSTAVAVAQRVGIDTQRPPVRGAQLEGASDAKLAEMVRETDVFARIAPEDKLRVVRALQAQGEVVAVTGDGVNDAPALREAAIGVTMGRSGTDVAREAADLVLADDNFATVTEAVRTGRVLYANLRKAVRYYLAAKVALVSASLAAVLLKLPVPFEPVQIILMELFMDLGASVTFVAEPPERDVMAQPPRDPRRPFMDRSMQMGIVFGGLSLGAAVLIAYVGASRMGADLAQAQTAAFAAWMLGHVVLAAHMRAERQPLLATNPLANRPFLIWAACSVGMLALAALVPRLQHQLHLSVPTQEVWWMVVAVALLVPSWWEPWKWFARTHAGALGAR
ncbi:MAG: cation-transporting P-type ATPase [Burkholderiales bacterium]|nr:cation-transporting P-type ATPase [Burkholderiales bacterium]